jgi:hypothetical protein
MVIRSVGPEKHVRAVFIYLLETPAIVVERRLTTHVPSVETDMRELGHLHHLLRPFSRR